jgi:hypothetical protein
LGGYKIYQKVTKSFPLRLALGGIFHNPIMMRKRRQRKIKRETVVSKTDFQRQFTDMTMYLTFKVFERNRKHHPLSFENIALPTLAIKWRIAIIISKKPLRGVKS